MSVVLAGRGRSVRPPLRRPRRRRHATPARRRDAAVPTPGTPDRDAGARRAREPYGVDREPAAPDPRPARPCPSPRRTVAALTRVRASGSPDTSAPGRGNAPQLPAVRGVARPSVARRARPAKPPHTPGGG